MKLEIILAVDLFANIEHNYDTVKYVDHFAKTTSRVLDHS